MANLKDFNFSINDLVYVRTASGIVTDKITNITRAGIVQLERIKKDFYMNGRPVESSRSVYRIIDIYSQKDNISSFVSENWITQLAEEDDVIVALSNGRKILTHVTRITAAGKIKVKNNHEMFYSDGTSVHRGRLSAWLEPATDEAKDIIQQQINREKSLQTISKCNFSTLTTEKLLEIYKIIES